MSMVVSQRPTLAVESLLSDHMYRRCSTNQREPRLAPAPEITMEAAQTHTTPFGQISFDPAPPRWFLPLLDKICALGNLPPNWDSYGAKPIDREAAIAAVEIILRAMESGDPHPAIVPTNRGGILLEWHEGGVDLEVDIRSPHSLHLSFDDGTSEHTIEDAGMDAIGEMLRVLRVRFQRESGNG